MLQIKSWFVSERDLFRIYIQKRFHYSYYLVDPATEKYKALTTLVKFGSRKKNCLPSKIEFLKKVELNETSISVKM
jgi:hypothetical protein